MALGSTKPVTGVPGVFRGGKDGRCVRLTTYHHPCAVATKSGNLNFLERSGPVQACNETALPVPLPLWESSIYFMFAPVMRIYENILLIIIYFCVLCIVVRVLLLFWVTIWKIFWTATTEYAQYAQRTLDNPASLRSYILRTTDDTSLLINDRE